MRDLPRRSQGRGPPLLGEALQTLTTVASGTHEFWRTRISITFDRSGKLLQTNAI